VIANVTSLTSRRPYPLLQEAHRSTKAAHEFILDALEEAIFHLTGIRTERRNILSVTKTTGKPRRGDLVLKGVDLGNHHTLHRPRAPPNMRDELFFPATVPQGLQISILQREFLLKPTHDQKFL